MPTNDPPTCPTCGQAAEVPTSDEGTTFVRQLERAADLLRRDRAVADLAREARQAAEAMAEAESILERKNRFRVLNRGRWLRLRRLSLLAAADAVDGGPDR